MYLYVDNDIHWSELRTRIIIFRSKILSSPKGSDFASQNKEENPLLLQGQSHFASQNKED